MVDDKSIEELRALLAKATPGPWEVDYLDKNGQRVIRQEHIEIATLWHHSVGSIEKEMEANAALVVAMRNALPDLLDLATASLAREGEGATDQPKGGDANAKAADKTFESDNSLWQHWRAKHKGQEGIKAPPRPKHEMSLTEELVDARIRRDLGESLSEYDHALPAMFKGY